jgi:hypothetical protein
LRAPIPDPFPTPSRQPDEIETRAEFDERLARSLAGTIVQGVRLT